MEKKMDPREKWGGGMRSHRLSLSFGIAYERRASPSEGGLRR